MVEGFFWGHNFAHFGGIGPRMKTRGGQEILRLPLSWKEKTRTTITYSLTNFILAKKWDFTLLLFSKEAGLVLRYNDLSQDEIYYLSYAGTKLPKDSNVLSQLIMILSKGYLCFLFMSLFFLFLFFMVFALASFPDLCIAQRNENTIFWKFSGIHFQVAKRFDDISPSCGLFESITDSSKRESFFTLSKIWSIRSGKSVIRWSTRLMLCISAPKK